VDCHLLLPVCVDPDELVVNEAKLSPVRGSVWGPALHVWGPLWPPCVAGSDVV